MHVATACDDADSLTPFTGLFLAVFFFRLISLEAMVGAVSSAVMSFLNFSLNVSSGQASTTWSTCSLNSKSSVAFPAFMSEISHYRSR